MCCNNYPAKSEISALCCIWLCIIIENRPTKYILRQSMTRHLQAAVDRQLVTVDLVFMIVTHPLPRLPHQYTSSISFPHIGKHTFTFLQFLLWYILYISHFRVTVFFTDEASLSLTIWPIECIKWFYFKNSFQKIQLIDPLFLKIILKRLKLKEEISLKMSENFCH